MDEELEKALDTLRQKRAVASRGGEAGEIELQRRKGKLTARERIDQLLDPGSFNELGMFGACRKDAEKDIYGDGIVVGYGKISDMPVCIFSQDMTVRKGTTGQIHRLKMTSIAEKARKSGVPLICLWDSAGGRLEPDPYIIPANYCIFKRFIINSGIVPQVSAILGPGAGNAAYGAAFTDFVFLVDGLSYVFATGPDGIREELGEEVSMEDLGGAKVHCQLSGLGDRRFDSEVECFSAIRKLLSYLPPNNEEPPPRTASSHDPPWINEALNYLVPRDPKRSYDMLVVIQALVDGGNFFEIKPEFARNIITGFGRLNGYPVGIVANQPMYLAGALTIDASDKATRFVRFADCFNLPLILLVDTSGYLPGSAQEHAGLIRHGAKLPFALGESRVPKIAVLIRKAYGGAKPAMGIDKDMGVDLVYAWPLSESSVMGASGTVRVLFKKKIEAMKVPKTFIKGKIDDYKKISSPYHMAYTTFVDAIIEPAETRAVLIRGLEALIGEKRRYSPSGHNNMPV